MAKNRFAALLEERGLPVDLAPEQPPTQLRDTSPTPLPEPPPAPIKTGKRSDPGYRQISTYVRAPLYKEVRKRLTDEERDFADLLDELLTKWLTPA